MSSLTHPKQKCVKCGAIDETEIITRTTAHVQQRILRCLKCGHEKTILTRQWIKESEKWIVFNAESKEGIEEF